MRIKGIFLYVAILLPISWAYQYVVMRYIGMPDEEIAQIFFALHMFFPAILSIIFAKLYGMSILKPIKLPRILPLILAILIPVFIAFAFLGILSLFDFGRSDYFSFASLSQANINSGPWLLGIGEMSIWRFAANILLTGLVYSLIGGIVAIGEEYGWRGILQPALINSFGFIKGVTLLGFIWAIWHFPIILAGYNYPHTPYLGAFVILPFLLIMASFVLAGLTIWARSIWPAVLMHAMINSVYDSMITKTTTEMNTQSYALLTAFLEIGSFAILALIVIGFYKKLS